MADVVNTGSGANAGDGDPLRTAYTKINAAFVVRTPVYIQQADPAPAGPYLWVKTDGSGVIIDLMVGNAV